MINQTKKIKIGLIGDSLSKGGAEKIHAILSNYFEKQDYEVHNCILIDAITYDYSGSLLNLGKIKPNSSSILRKTYRFFALQKWIKCNNFDCLIDFRMRPSFILEYILSKMVYPKNTIYTVHSGVLEFYFLKSSFLSKLIYKNKKIVPVSIDIENKIIRNYSLKKTKTIYNPFDLGIISILKEEEITENKYILAVGSMNSSIKQFDKLIQAYSKSELPNLHIKLVILGEGKYKISYQKLVETLNLSSLVQFKGNVKNPFPYYKKALFCVLSSKNEGLPNALIESLACETPVVGFDCFSGPREIICNHENGLLIKNQDFDKLVDAMNLMVSDQDLYLHCKKNAAKSIEKFSVKIIGKQWEELINS